MSASTKLNIYALANVVREYLGDDERDVYKKRLLVESAFFRFQRPVAVIFLGIDGVIEDPLLASTQTESVNKKLGELFQKSLIVKGANGFPDYHGYTDLELQIGQSYFFYDRAVTRLNQLVKELRKNRPVAIVLYSPRSACGTMHELVSRVFDRCAFSRCMIDKISTARADHIRAWLKKNKEILGIGKSVIFCADANGLSKVFPKSIVEVGPRILLDEHCKAAYRLLSVDK